MKNVSGRKTDVLDCQWLQQLHTYGLLSGAFRPHEQVCTMRAYSQQRSMLIAQASSHIQHMQKALTQVSGGKRLSGRSKRTANYVASALRIAASTLHRSESALGAFFRRLRLRLGAPKATTATAHKMGRIIFDMLSQHTEYHDLGQDYYEKQYRERMIKGLSSRAKMLGFTLVEAAC